MVWGHLELGGIFMKGIRKLLKSVLVMAIAFSLFSSSLANDLVGNPTKAEAYYDNLYVIDLRPGVSYSAKTTTNKLSAFDSEHPQLSLIYLICQKYALYTEEIERIHDRFTFVPTQRIIDMEYDPLIKAYASPGCFGVSTFQIDEYLFYEKGRVDFPEESKAIFDNIIKTLGLTPKKDGRNWRYIDVKIVFGSIQDQGTYTLDFTKGDVTVPHEEYVAVANNLNKHVVLGNIVMTNSANNISLLDLDDDGTNDISLHYYQPGSPSSIYGVFSMLDTCSITDSIVKTSTMEDSFVYSPFDETLPFFYSKILLVFPKPLVPELPPSVNEQIEASKKDYLDGSLKAPVLKSIEPKNRAIKVSWKKLKSKDIKRIDGYEIQISTSKNFSKDVKLVVVQKKKTSVSLKKLKNGRKYYVRIRSIKDEGEHKHFSNWSKKKSVILQKIKGGGKNI